MEKRSILSYWLLILIPAVIISLAAFQLLSHEQERINRLAISAIEDRTRAIGETLQVTVEAVEDELTQSLLNIPEKELKRTLLELEKSNALVRNVFIWNEKNGLIYPLSGPASTTEENHFITRFDGLFSGRIAWHSKNGDIETDQYSSISAPQSDTEQALSKIKPNNLTQSISKLKEGRQELLKIAKGYDVNIDGKSITGADESSTTWGWIPWFAENKLYILGWVKAERDGPVYGIELELMTLLSRMIGSFPPIPSDQSGYALVDDEGRLLHQAGRVDISNKKIPLLTLSLAPHLPHWSLAVYVSDQNNLLFGSGHEFLILTGLLLMIFVVAIIAGGSLLLRQANRNMIDARQKTSFVSNVSHELKTPLTSIRMFAELLMEDRIKDPEKKKKYLQVIVSESRRLTRLVNNVLDFSRLEQGQKKYHFEKISPKAFLHEILEFHGPRIKDVGMEVILNLPGEDIRIKTDRDALEQIFLNLIDNAIKYARDGKEITISMNADDENLVIEVEDRGPGVPESHRKKIFNKFHRVDDTLTSKQQGSGLGLSISMRMLKDLGGDLRYSSRQGGGSSFIATIPLNPDNKV